MKSADISSALVAHLASSVTSLATLWRIARRDGRVFAFTDHDRDIAFAGEIYRAALGYARTDVETSDSLAVDTLDLRAIVDSSAVTAADIRAGRWDLATVEISLVNWRAPEHGRVRLRRGFIGEVALEEVGYGAELRGLLQLLQQEIGRVYTPDCAVDLGSPECGVDLGALAVQARVASAQPDRRSFTVPASAAIRAAVDLAQDIVIAHQAHEAGGAIEVALFATMPDGTARNPYPVSTASGLDAMRDDPQAWYALERDIDLAGWGKWAPIADWRGGLDGRGFEIRNADLDFAASAREAGLFETLRRGAHVRRLTLRNFTVRAGSPNFYAAPLAARASGGETGDWGIVEDVLAIGCSVTTDGDRAAGLVGVLDLNGALRRCLVVGSLNGTIGSRVGGVTGFVALGSSQTTPQQAHLLFDSDAAGTTALGVRGAASALTASALADPASFAGFDLEAAWHGPVGGPPGPRRWWEPPGAALAAARHPHAAGSAMLIVAASLAIAPARHTTRAATAG